MKKGAYDIGRKAIYYIIIVFVLGTMILYTSNMFGRYEVTIENDVRSARDVVKISKAINCISVKKDTGTYLGVVDESKLSKFQECMQDPNVILLLEESPEFNVESVDRFNSYTKAVIRNGKLGYIKLRIVK